MRARRSPPAVPPFAVGVNGMLVKDDNHFLVSSGLCLLLSALPSPEKIVEEEEEEEEEEGGECLIKDLEG